jgi:signal transduction histidine kinase
MFNSLRSRLFISYIIIITAALSLVALALLALSATQTARIIPTLRQLSAIGQGVRREFIQLAEQGRTGLPVVQRVLDEVASIQEVRAVLINKTNDRVLYDTGGGETWTSFRAGEVIRPRGEFLNIEPAIPIGSYRSPGGDRWLVYSQPLADRGGNQLILLFGRPEPTAIQFFRETFLRPLTLAGLIALLLSILLAVLISRSVARPLKGMAEASELIAQGEYEQHLPQQGPDEVQRLARSFNSMATQVNVAQQAQRDLVTNISHDLKTPLTSIRGWSQAALDGTANTPGEQRNAFTIIQDEAKRMERMVDQLLELARIESGQFSLAQNDVDLNLVLSEIQSRFTVQAQERGIDLVLELAPVQHVTGDQDRLDQAISNLVDNALAYTQEGGRVAITLRPYGEAFVEIAVSDTGSGIPPEEIDRVFERFYQLDKSREGSGGPKGSGVGLAIVKELVEAHGGHSGDSD